MPLQKLGLNFSNLNNITPPTFDIKNNSREFLNDIPIKANETTQGFLGLFTLVSLFFFLMWRFNQDLADGGDYAFSTYRSMGIAFGVCSIVGIFCLNVGYFTNFYHVAIFIIATFIMTGVIWKNQN